MAPGDLSARPSAKSREDECLPSPNEEWLAALDGVSQFVCHSSGSGSATAVSEDLRRSGRNAGQCGHEGEKMPRPC
jgi:hypothetical protein